jgi:hypothetical protein
VINYKELDAVTFPTPQGLNVNMMPFIFGDPESLPKELHAYLDIINRAQFDSGITAYLTVQESWVSPGSTQRRPGLHTDSHGGAWGGKSLTKGLYMASTDGLCELYDEQVYEIDQHGGLLVAPVSRPHKAKANTLYWLSDRTPHASIPSPEVWLRQFYRLVSDEVGVWWSKHSTPNRLGVLPGCPVEHRSKF